MGVEFPQEGYLLLKTDYSAPLERQKRALERFNKTRLLIRISSVSYSIQR